MKSTASEPGLRSKDHVDYVALNNLFLAEFETASKGKRKYKRGAKLYQVEIVIDLGIFGHIDRGSNH